LHPPGKLRISYHLFYEDGHSEWTPEHQVETFSLLSTEPQFEDMRGQFFTRFSMIPTRTEAYLNELEK
jgi:hypothetical protein